MPGRILVIDPNAQRRMLLKSLLLEGYYLVDVVTAADDPMLTLRAQYADLVFLACDPEDPLAIPALQKLQGQVRTSGVPIVATGPLSANSAHLLAAGADDVILGCQSTAVWHARARALVRQKVAADELRLQEKTARGLGIEPGDIHTMGPSKFRVTFFTGGGAENDPIATRLGCSSKMHVRPIHSAAAAHASCTVDPDTALLLRVGCKRTGSQALQLVARLRSAPKTRFTPIIMLVDPAHQDIAVQGLEIGLSDFVQTDVALEELIARLGTHRRRFKLYERLRADLACGLEMAVTDPLTKMLNRRYATAQIPQMMSQSVDAAQPFSLMLIDIDNFKGVNDCFGHAIGDLVLVEAANRLRGAVRSVDLVARFGGEEFLVALPSADETAAALVAERVRAAVAASPIYVIGETGVEVPLSITVSVGLAQIGACKDITFDTLFARADLAMYRSKRNGRNQVSLDVVAA